MGQEKIILALQFWKGDRTRAMELAQVLASIEPEFNEDALLLLSYRFDCPPPDPAVVEQLRKKFHVELLPGQTKFIGYPNGPFAIWMDTVDWARDFTRSGKSLAKYLFTFEADACPLCRDWIPRLLAALDREKPTCFAGAWQNYPPKSAGHINGNLVVVLDNPPALDAVCDYRRRFVKGTPWDLEIYPVAQQHGSTDLKEIVSEFRSHDIPREHLAGLMEEGRVFHHGCKDKSVFRWLLDGNPVQTKITDDGIRVYTDEIPSVLSQLPKPSGLVKFDLPRNEGEVTIFRKNGSHVKDHGGGYWLAFREQRSVWQKRLFEPSKIRMSRFYPESGRADIVSEVSGLEFWASDWVDHYEDPRLVNIGGKLFLSYVHSAYTRDGFVCNQRLGELSADRTRVVRNVPLNYGNNSPTIGRNEKNWTFFGDIAGALRAVYKVTGQHVVIDPVKGKSWRAPLGKSAESWEKKFGQIRGGTGPVRVRGTWLSFFHSHTPHPRGQRRYHVGAYVFGCGANNYAPMRFSAKPLLSGSLQDGLGWDIDAGISFQPLVIFPGGCTLNDKGDEILLTSGVNEHSVSSHRIPVADVFESF